MIGDMVYYLDRSHLFEGRIVSEGNGKTWVYGFRFTSQDLHLTDEVFTIKKDALTEILRRLGENDRFVDHTSTALSPVEQENLTSTEKILRTMEKIK